MSNQAARSAERRGWAAAPVADHQHVISPIRAIAHGTSLSPAVVSLKALAPAGTAVTVQVAINTVRGIVGALASADR